MILDGLQAILDKEEIVATQRAGDLLKRPKAVDTVYKRHVRTYIPLGRQASGNNSGQSVTNFERRVIREVKQAGALRGYITAEYGHGKTSTALYLWQQARAENILAIPPFQLNKLSDLLRATFGWARYEIERTRPNSKSLNEAEDLYRSLVDRGAESLAQQYNMPTADAQKLARERPDILDLTPADYIDFFEKMTLVAQEAGFLGLLVIADELQQYIDPEVKAGVKDPVSPLFDVIGAILTRRKHLNFGLIMVIPPKELGQLRDARGDFIHRLLQVSLDLRTVYDQDFPRRLWQRLAKESGFAEHQNRIISQECLTALGQIAARSDLSDGPRTVINTFRRATKHYIEADYPGDNPYTPETLVNDLLHGRIQYDSSKKIAQVASRALNHSLVKGDPKKERAVKWAAAFPNEGIPRSLQENLGLLETFDELAQSALGDLIISVGDIKTKGITLRGLEEAQIETDWLSMTTRQFWRNYVETADIAKQRALNGFTMLLKTRVFPENQWKVIKEIPERFTQNRGIIVEGAFTGSQQRFPERRIHIRILWEDESIKDAHTEGEVLIQIRLRRYLDKKESERRYEAKQLEIDYDSHRIDLTLNLMRRVTEVPPNLAEKIESVILPYKITPLLLLNLHQVIDEHRQRDAIPKADDQYIKHLFQRDLLDHTFHELFNDTVGAPVKAAQERIIELAAEQLLEAMYPTYSPLMVVSNWTSSLKKYNNALGNLETSHERQGQIVVEGTKSEIANLFPLSNTGLDSFARNFSTLISGVNKIAGKNQGVVTFTLHPLERSIKKWLQSSSQTETVSLNDQAHETHRLPKHEIYDRAHALGYREKETETILDLMVTRGLVDLDERRGYVREAITQAPSVDELEAEINEWIEELTALQSIFTTDPQIRQWLDTAQKGKQTVQQQLRKKPDETRLIQSRRRVKHERQQLELFIQKEHKRLQQEVTRLLGQLPHLQQNRLQTSIQGSVEFSFQVNDLRTRLLKRYTRLDEDINQLRQRIRSRKTALDVDGLSIPTLVDLVQEIRAFEPKINELQNRRQEFQMAFDQYAKWVELVDQGSQLGDDIQQLGDLVSEQKAAFKQLSRDILGELSERKTEALPDAPSYAMRLSEIRTEVRQLKAKATNQFADLQEGYRQAFTVELGFPTTQLWKPLQYNPVAPQASYQRLKEDVQEALQYKVLQRLKKTVTEEIEAIQATLSSPLLKNLPSSEQTQLSRKGETISKELTDLEIQLQSVQQKTEDMAVINDLSPDKDGQFDQLVQSLKQIRDEITKQYEQVENLGAALRQLKLTPEEERIYESLPDHQVDVGKIDRIKEQVGEEEFWQALGSLRAKRRINIQIEKVRHD
jgi:hypothetical protein